MRLPSGEEFDAIIPSGLSDDQAKSLMRMKRPDLFGAPAGIPHQTTQDIGNQMVREHASAGLAGVPGGSVNPQPASDTYAAAVGAPVGAAAAYMGGANALPFLKGPIGNAIKAIPTIGAMEGINYARQHLPWGKYIPAGAEWLPVFMHGAGGPKAPEAAAESKIGTAATDQLPGRPYMPNPRYTPPPEPQPIPPRTSPLLLEGEVAPSAAPGMPRSVANKTLDRTLTQAVGNEPIKPGVPLRQQGSAVVKNFRYDPQAQELHVTTHDGTTYVSGEVTPEQAQAFQDAPSKGQAWKAIRENSPLVGKVPAGGKRIAMKGAQEFKSADPNANDLTDILTRSLREAQAGR